MKRTCLFKPPASARSTLFKSAAAALAVTLAALTTACTSGASSSARATQRDSAGVVIVENTGSVPVNAAGWGVAAEPTLSIGTVDGESPYQLYGVAGAHRFSDGRIGVVNAGSREVRIFSPEGVHLRTFGQQGGGPEEFEMPVLGGAVNDTLFVVDRAHHRISNIHPDAGFVRVARVSDEVGGYLNPTGTFANGETVFGGAFDMRRIGEVRNGINRAHTFYRSSGPDGALATDFGDKAGAEFYVRDLDGEGPDSRPALFPFAKVPVATVSPNHFFFGDQDAFEVEVYEPSGRLARVVRLAWDPIPVTEEDRARHIEAVVAQVGDPDQASQIRQQLGSLPLPDVFPAHGAIMADLLGCLWVEDFQRPGAENRAWNIFNPEGVLVARVTLPERFNPMEIGRDYVLGVGSDDLDVEYVRLYAVERPG